MNKQTKLGSKPMRLNEYQKQARSTDVFKSSGPPAVTDPAFVAKILGLVGESGEVAEKFKKIIRNQKGEISPEDKQELAKELGDVLWYSAVLASYLNLDLEDIGRANLDKLADRHKRGVISSKGDNR